MKLGFQHFGNLHIVIKAFMNSVGCETVSTPQPNRKTLEYGVRSSPEMVCFPFKLTLGDLMQSLELGADTLVFLGSGTWSCRFGYYGRVQYQILKKLGFDFNPIFLNAGNLFRFTKELVKLNGGKWTKTILKMVYGARLALYKSAMIDKVESWTRLLRPLEANLGNTTLLCRHLITAIDNTSSLEILRILDSEIENAFCDIQIDTSRDLFRVLIIGESYCVIEPFANLNLFEYLGGLGIIADPFITTHRWFCRHVLRKEVDRRLPKNKAISIAKPLWAYGTGGEEQICAGYFLDAVNRRIDGVIHIMPMSCMPENAVLPVMMKISKQTGIPFLSLSFDEHSGVESVYTRLEAFIDLLNEKRKKCRFAL